MNAGMRVANLMSFSCTSFRLDLNSFSSALSSFFSFGDKSLSFALFFRSLTASLLLMMVSMMLSPRARHPSMRSTAAIASGLSRIRRSVSLSTFTSNALSHLRASNVAEVPAIAISRMPPASICVMFAPS